jgi:uncharacterized protein YmfQ (DUF2313 family)
MRFPFRFPAAFGSPGRSEEVEIEHQAILDALAPAWDVAEGTALYGETLAEAFAVTAMWHPSRRLSNQLLPTRMLDNFTDYERACNLRPRPGETTKERRSRLAAKLRAVVSNALRDLGAACLQALGDAFVELVTTDEADAIVYWPAVNPGPPGYEWSSNRATVCVHVDKTLMSEAEFRRRRQALFDLLRDTLPAWMTAVIGIGSGSGSSFVCNQGIVGQTVI